MCLLGPASLVYVFGSRTAGPSFRYSFLSKRLEDNYSKGTTINNLRITAILKRLVQKIMSCLHVSLHSLSPQRSFVSNIDYFEVKDTLRLFVRLFSCLPTLLLSTFVHRWERSISIHTISRLIGESSGLY